MRALLVPLAVALALAPGVLAAPHGGNGVGVEADAYSAGVWDVYFVRLSAPATMTANLTWVNSPGGADYDLSLWAPGAASDGRLSQSELLQTSWTNQNSPGETLTRALAPIPSHSSPYVLTVEAASAKLETYYLNVTGSGITTTKTCHSASQYAFGWACIWSAQGLKQR